MDDLISRQDAIDTINHICDRDCEYPKEVRADMCVACPLGSAYNAIQDIPPAQKIGHWIELETWLGRGVICSECGKLALHQVWSDGSGEIECEYAKSNYCPSCGIKMEG